MNFSLPFTDSRLLKAIEKEAKVMEFEAGETIIDKGQYIKIVPIVLRGSVKVLRTDEAGHELFLYYIESGETCAMSLTCCSTLSPSDIKAVAEEKTVISGIPVGKHEEWANDYKQWKEFVAFTYQKRFQELLLTIDAIAFQKMDERLLRYLVTKSTQLNALELSITHQEIASELGSSREVISRLLKQLEKRKLVELGRNTIYVRHGLKDFLGRESG